MLKVDTNDLNKYFNENEKKNQGSHLLNKNPNI